MEKNDVKYPFYGQNAFYQTWDIDGTMIPRFNVSTNWQRLNTFRSTPNPGWMAVKNQTILPRGIKRLKLLDLGNGDFHKEDSQIHSLSYPYHSTSPFGSLGIHYSGPFLPLPADLMRIYALEYVPWPDLSNVTAELFGLGGTAISRTLPNKDHMSLLTSLLELRKDGLPRLFSATLARGMDRPVKDTAGQYLEYQFGWLPLINDVISLLTAVVDSKRILDEYRKLSGSHIRRRYAFDTIEKSFSDTRINTPPAPSSSNEYLSAGPVTLDISGTYTSKAWFSGAYRFPVPESKDSETQMERWAKEANHLLGIGITPEVLWNVTSWTWLLDWFVNIGNIVTNISYLGRDGLVLHYGYIMRHVHLEATFVNRGYLPRGGVVPLSAKISIDQKARRKASPYGFGLNPESFSLKQWSILGALGLARSPGKAL